MEKDEQFKDAHNDVIESLVDFAESQATVLMKGIPVIDGNKIIDWTVKPSETMLIFFLKTKGKQRGYIERQELTGKDGEDLHPKQTIDYKKLSDEVLAELIAATTESIPK